MIFDAKGLSVQEIVDRSKPKDVIRVYDVDTLRKVLHFRKALLVVAPTEVNIFSELASVPELASCHREFQGVEIERTYISHLEEKLRHYKKLAAEAVKASDGRYFIGRCFGCHQKFISTQARTCACPEGFVCYDCVRKNLMPKSWAHTKNVLECKECSALE